MDIQDFLIQGEGSIEDKQEAWNYFQKAYEHQMKGELEEAVNMYKRSIESHPTAEAYTFLGWTYSFMGATLIGATYMLVNRGAKNGNSHQEGDEAQAEHGTSITT